MYQYTVYIIYVCSLSVIYDTYIYIIICEWVVPYSSGCIWLRTWSLPSGCPQPMQRYHSAFSMRGSVTWAASSGCRACWLGLLLPSYEHCWPVAYCTFALYIYIIYIIYRNIPTKSYQYDATNECISVVQQVPKILCMPAVAIGAFWIFWYEWQLASACCLCPEILLMIKVFSQPVSTTGRTSSQPALANMQDHARITSEWQVQQCSRIQKDSICS
jgi:hypothetical protein